MIALTQLNDAVRRMPPYFSSEAVAAHFNVTRPTAVERLKDLERAGHIEAVSNRVWRITRRHAKLPVPRTNSRIELPFLHTPEPLHIRDACKIAGIDFTGNSVSVQVNKLTTKGVLIIPKSCPLPGIYLHVDHLAVDTTSF